MPKFAEATRNETLYRYTSHIRVRKSRTENANDRISGQCRAAAVIFRINEAGYRGNNGTKSQDQSWLNATSPDGKDHAVTEYLPRRTLDADYVLDLIATYIKDPCYV
ncbi:unnamed protein product [Lasius platythorax]|uniref:Uncharacterized protein n=1 Tax=Lasius platythorax TaxID=488582 RepID=A0AAV2PAL8_9HYME